MGLAKGIIGGNIQTCIDPLCQPISDHYFNACCPFDRLSQFSKSYTKNNLPYRTTKLAEWVIDISDLESDLDRLSVGRVDQSLKNHLSIDRKENAKDKEIVDLKLELEMKDVHRQLVDMDRGIRESVEAAQEAGELEKLKFAIVDVNLFCKTLDNEYIPAEIGELIT